MSTDRTADVPGPGPTTGTGTDVVMAGFGGQGMLLAGQMLAHAAMETGMQVSWLPSYGPEMRGGTANVTVCLSPQPIASPLVTKPQSLVVMNLPSLERFAQRVRPGGLIVVNSSLIDRGAERPDCREVRIPAREWAKEAGSDRAANIVMLGAYVGASHVVPAAAVEHEIETMFTGAKARFAPSNLAAFRAGLAAGEEVASNA